MKRSDIQFVRKNRFALRNRTIIQWMVVIVSFWSILFKSISLLPGPLSYLKYVPDGFLLVLLVLALFKKRFSFRRTLLSPLRLVLIFFSFCLITGICRYQSVAYFLWGFRNNFRFYIAFFAFIVYLDEFDAEVWFKGMDLFFWINAGLSAIQFFLWGIKGDALGGIFGVLGASNGYTTCFMSIVVGKTILDAFMRKKGFAGALAKVIVSIVVAVMAEIKFFFFIVAFLIFGAAIITGFSVRKIIYVLLGAVVLSLGAMVLVDMFGFEDFLSLEKLWENATKENYASKGDVNRLTAVASVTRRLDMNIIDQIFGFGLGNCDTSAFAICNTPFYRQHGYMHYHWFVSSMVFLEMGYVGLVLYISFFCICIEKAYKNNRRGIGKLLYYHLAILISALCIILVFYDSSLRIESGYMMYFVLALPFFQQRSVQTACT